MKFLSMVTLSLFIASPALAESRESKLIAEFKNDLQIKCVSLLKEETEEVVENPDQACAQNVVPRLLEDGVLEGLEVFVKSTPAEIRAFRVGMNERYESYQDEVLVQPVFIIASFALNNLLDKLEGKK